MRGRLLGPAMFVLGLVFSGSTANSDGARHRTAPPVEQPIETDDGARSIPAPAAAVGYTYQVVSLGPFNDLSSVDCNKGHSSKAFYTANFTVPPAPCFFSVADGNLVLNEIGRAS